MKKRIQRLCRMIIVSFVNHFLCGTHFWSIKRTLLSMSGFQIGDGTKIVGPFLVGNVVNIIIGNNCWVGHNFAVEGNGNVVIGNDCDIAPEVSILTGSHEIGDHHRRAGEGVQFSIEIGSGCWVGARSTITGNTKVGDGTVIAACAFVNKDVGEDAVVAGVPARQIKSL